jgi:cysteine desulfurase/selenocysteine lyase
MPSFESFPLFEAALPAIPRMAALPTEDDVTAALNSVSSFYFLEDAGALSKPATAKSAPPVAARVSPSLLPDLQLTRKQFDVSAVRRDFPILQERVNGKPLIWLDNAATTQKPQSVIDRISYFYEHENSNIHRAAHELAARATDAYEEARRRSRAFLTRLPSTRLSSFAAQPRPSTWWRRVGDVAISARTTRSSSAGSSTTLTSFPGRCWPRRPVRGCVWLLWMTMGRFCWMSLRSCLIRRPVWSRWRRSQMLLAPSLPTRKQIVQMAHRYGARVLVDGAQSVSHMSTDVQALDCDFFVFSGHKVFGPTGIGVLYGKADALADSPPWQGGGNMIVDVTFEKTIYQAPPARFEAGTGNIADAVGLGAALDYVEELGMENIARHEHDLLIYATKALLTIPGLRLIGTAKEKASVLSFVLEGFRPKRWAQR